MVHAQNTLNRKTSVEVFHYTDAYGYGRGLGTELFCGALPSMLSKY